MRSILVVVLSTVPAVASASGFYLSDNGAKTLMMGGAFAGQADDLSAIQHNPAGLAQLEGFQFIVDAELLLHSISFQRYDPGFDPSNPPNALSQPVTNSGGLFPLPVAGVGFGFKLLDRNLTVALGVYGPPAAGKYVYPTPNYDKCTAEVMMAGTAGEACDTMTDLGKYLASPNKTASQRYALMDNEIFILYPTLSAAYAVHPKAMVGISLQPVLGSFHFSQAVTSQTRVFPTPMRQADEQPIFDSVVNVNLPWQLVGFTAIPGVLVKPVDWISVGVSFRPQIMINAKGSANGKTDVECKHRPGICIEPGEAARGLGTTVLGDSATLSLMLPAELKVGVHVQPIQKLGVNFDFVYQGWQSVKEIVLDPYDVSFSMGGDAQKVAPFHIEKNWVPSYHFRLGAEYALFSFLSLYLGGWYETGAIPAAYTGVDFLHFGRVNITGGAGLHFGAFDILIGAAGSPSSTTAITDSAVRAGSTEPPTSPPAGIVGAGVYTSSSFMATIGIRGNFGRVKEAPKPVEVPKETPPIPPVELTPVAPQPAPQEKPK